MKETFNFPQITRFIMRKWKKFILLRYLHFFSFTNSMLDLKILEAKKTDFYRISKAVFFFPFFSQGYLVVFHQT